MPKLTNRLSKTLSNMLRGTSPAIGKVFISHASADKPFVDRLASDLAQRGISLWYDKLDLRIGDSVPGKINEGLASSKYFIIVLSPRSVSSRWVQEELNAALMRAVASSGTFLLPALYQDCDIPPLVKHRKYADFRNDYSMGLADILDLFGRDVDVSNSLAGKYLYPWPDIDQPESDNCYLHSTRFDKFFRMNCDFQWTVSKSIEYVTEILKLPWSQDLPQLGMRWSFSYALVLNDHAMSLSSTLAAAGVSIGSMLRLNISGTFEDLWENELRSMWDGTKMYEVTGAMRRDAELRDAIERRGELSRDKLRKIVNSCFSHV